MRPIDIYALPTIESVPWHEETWGRLRHLYEDGDMLMSDLDSDAAREAGASALVFETKLEADSDHDRGIRYTAVTFEGRPVAILLGYGRGKDDHLRRFVTDTPGYRAARDYVERFLHPDARTAHDRTEPEAEIPELAGAYGHRVVAHGEGAVLVPDSWLDPDGRPILDAKAFREAVERDVMPTLRARGRADEPESERGLLGARVRDLVAQAILDCLGADVVGTTDFAPVPREKGGYRKLAWAGILAASGEHTYAIGITSYGMNGYLGWTSTVDVDRVGPRELYDTLARDAGTSPRP